MKNAGSSICLCWCGWLDYYYLLLFGKETTDPCGSNLKKVDLIPRINAVQILSSTVIINCYRNPYQLSYLLLSFVANVIKKNIYKISLHLQQYEFK